MVIFSYYFFIHLDFILVYDNGVHIQDFFRFDSTIIYWNICLLYTLLVRVRLKCYNKGAVKYNDLNKMEIFSLTYHFRIHVPRSVGDSAALSHSGLRLCPFFLSTVKAVILQMWSLHQKHQHYLRTCQKYQFLISHPRHTDSETMEIGSSNLYFNKPSGGF